MYLPLTFTYNIGFENVSQSKSQERGRAISGALEFIAVKINKTMRH